MAGPTSELLLDLVRLSNKSFVCQGDWLVSLSEGRSMKHVFRSVVNLSFIKCRHKTILFSKEDPSVAKASRALHHITLGILQGRLMCINKNRHPPEMLAILKSLISKVTGLKVFPRIRNEQIYTYCSGGPLYPHR